MRCNSPSPRLAAFPPPSPPPMSLGIVRGFIVTMQPSDFSSACMPIVRLLPSWAGPECWSDTDEISQVPTKSVPASPCITRGRGGWLSFTPWKTCTSYPLASFSLRAQVWVKDGHAGHPFLCTENWLTTFVGRTFVGRTLWHFDAESGRAPSVFWFHRLVAMPDIAGKLSTRG